MERTRTNRPGRTIFLSGVVLLVASTILGLYLASPQRGELTQVDWHTANLETVEAIRNLAVSQATLSANVHALMWLVFGLGVTLTLVGLRMVVHPEFEPEPLRPIKSFVDVFED